jgi:hypothetical protein
MAVQTPVEEHPSPGTYIYTWGPAGNADTFLPVMVPPSHNDKTVQVTGTPGAVLVLDIQGSDETVQPGTLFQSLREPGNAKLVTLLVTANLPDIRQILESVNQVKPVITSGGDGTTAITIRLKCTTQARR